MRQASNIVLFAVLLCAVSSFVGCGQEGPSYVPVEGKVIFKQDGTPAQFGTIEFRSESEPPIVARGKIQKDGSFQLKSQGRLGTIEGQHSVVIIQVVGNHRSGNVVHNHGLEVAKKYSSFRTSDLIVDVEEDTSQVVVLEVDAK